MCTFSRRTLERLSGIEAQGEAVEGVSGIEVGLLLEVPGEEEKVAGIIQQCKYMLILQ